MTSSRFWPLIRLKKKTGLVIKVFFSKNIITKTKFSEPILQHLIKEKFPKQQKLNFVF